MITFSATYLCIFIRELSNLIFLEALGLVMPSLASGIRFNRKMVALVQISLSKCLCSPDFNLLYLDFIPFALIQRAFSERFKTKHINLKKNTLCFSHSRYLFINLKCWQTGCWVHCKCSICKNHLDNQESGTPFIINCTWTQLHSLW